MNVFEFRNLLKSEDRKEKRKSFLRSLIKSVESGARLTSQREVDQWRNYFVQIVSSLIFAYKNLEMYDKAESVVNEWLSKNPDDPVAIKLLDDLKQKKK